MSSYMHFRNGKIAGWSISLSAIGTMIGLALLALLALPWWIPVIVIGCFVLAYGYDRFAAQHNARVEAENRTR